MIEVRIPATLREYCNVHDSIAVRGATVETAIQELNRTFPAIYDCICDETGTVRKHIHVFVNSQWIPVHEPIGSEASLKQGDILTIWTAVSGG